MNTDVKDDGCMIINLKVWEELIGVIGAIVEEDPFISIQLGNFELIFSSDSLEGRILKAKRKKIDHGDKIGILRTDIAEKPIIIRMIEMRRRDSPVSHNRPTKCVKVA